MTYRPPTPRHSLNYFRFQSAASSTSDRSWKRRMESTVAALQNGIRLLLQRQPTAVQVSPEGVVPPAQQSPGQQTSAAPSAIIKGPQTGSRQRPRGSGPWYKRGGEGHMARWCKQPSATVSTSQPDCRASSFEVAPSGNESDVYLDLQIGCKISKNLRVFRSCRFRMHPVNNASNIVWFVT